MAGFKKMPVVFTGHGYPMNAITDNPARAGWKKMGERIGKPEVIIAMTGHWEGDGTYMHVAPDNPQLFDIVDSCINRLTCCNCNFIMPFCTVICYCNAFDIAAYSFDFSDKICLFVCCINNIIVIIE